MKARFLTLYIHIYMVTRRNKLSHDGGHVPEVQQRARGGWFGSPPLERQRSVAYSVQHMLLKIRNQL